MVRRTGVEKIIFWARILSLVGLLIYFPSVHLDLFSTWNTMLKFEACSDFTRILAFSYSLFSISFTFFYFLIQKLPFVGSFFGFLFRFFSPVLIYDTFSSLFYTPLFMLVDKFQLWNDCMLQYNEYWHEFGSGSGSYLTTLYMVYLIVFIFLELSVAIIRYAFYSGESA